MLPSAVNFDPAAKQVGLCKFRTKGCMDPTSINYNSLATDNLPVGSTETGACIATVHGCTVAATTYYAVDSDTPSYKTGFYGSAATGAGGEPFLKKFDVTNYVGSAVVEYNPTANVMTNCTTAVEGCMDPTARNYDPLATINSYTWCVPDVVGCMIPDEAHQATGYNNPETASTVTGLIPSKPDEPTSTWSSTTTRHQASMCFHARYGCNVQGMLNYDSKVTVNTVCYEARVGCLNKEAVNYGCETYESTSECYPKDTSWESNATAEAQRVTRHVSSICKWSNESPPPSPPPPPLPPAGEYDTTFKVELKVTASGDVTYWSEASRQTALKTEYRVMMGTATDKEVEVGLVAVSSSRRLESSVVDGRRLQGSGDATEITFSATFDDAAAADTATSSVSSTVGTTPSSATAAFSSVGMTVLSAPSVVVQTIAVERSGSSSNAGLIGGIVGGIVGALILMGIGFIIYKRKNAKKDVYPA
jgi:hypothetical protein